MPADRVQCLPHETAELSGVSPSPGTKTSSTSCDQAIFVDQATGVRLFSDAVLAGAGWFG